MLAVVCGAACATDDDNMFDIRTLEDASFVDSGPPPKPNDTCVPEFCPALGSGVPCCITSEGPCGIDTGLGCQEFSPPSPQGDQ
jgi:hypothetical protein